MPFYWLLSVQISLCILDHSLKIHELVVKAINEYANSGKTIPEGMKILWDFKHEEFIEDFDDLKIKVSKL